VAATNLSSGIPALDDLLGGLIPGDNVVWIAERDDRYELLERAFLEASVRRVPTLVVAGTPADLRRPVPPGTTVLDATSDSRFHRAGALADEVERWMGVNPAAAIVVDGLPALARRWGAAEALSFFARMCPSMLQTGAVTYWRLVAALGPAFIERVRQITQCLLDLRPDQVQVLKAESRPDAVLGTVHHVKVTDGALTLTATSAGGRLARGLAALRKDLGLTQAQLAEAAGVTPSAVSQAEHGLRGLSLDTLLTLSDRLDVTLDRLVSAHPRAGYRLARHDRSRMASGSLIALADDATVGLRAFLVVLSGDEAASAPIEHKGIELFAVVRGFVQIDVGDDTPVLRAGDSLLAATDPVRGWRNLRPEPAVFYWVLRD
jgi:transcriptional regulator with XRE-family HTH domain